jgi:sugar phosphate permease
LSNTAATNYGPKTKYLMLLFMCLYVFLTNGFAVTSMNMLLGTVTKDLGWTAAEQGLVATAFPTGMIWTVLIGGIVADRLNIKRLMTGLLVLLALVVGLRAFVAGATPFYIMMFLFGVFMAFSIPIANKAVPMWFSGGKYFAVATGFVTSSNPLGQLFANLMTPTLIRVLGGRWQNLFILQGILLLMLALFFGIFAKNRSNLDAELSSELITKEEDITVWRNITEIVKVPQVWMYLIGNLFTLGIIFGGATMIYTILMTDPRWGLTMAQVGGVISFSNIASMIFYCVAPALIGRFLGKHWERNYRWIAIASGVLLAIIYPIGVNSFNIKTLSLIYFLGGILFGTFVPAPRILMMKLPQVAGARAGTALGLYYTFERIGQTAITAWLAVSMASGDPIATLSATYSLYLVSPALMAIAYVLEKRSAKKLAVS